MKGGLKVEDRITMDPEPVQLSIALQDGFSGENVIVGIDGQEIHRLEAQTTWEISPAGSAEVTVLSESHRIEIEVPARGVRSSHDIKVTGPLSGFIVNLKSSGGNLQKSLGTCDCLYGQFPARLSFMLGDLITIGSPSSSP